MFLIQILHKICNKNACRKPCIFNFFRFIRLAPKLSHENLIITNNKKKMKVSYTVQVFSATVASALLKYSNMGMLEKDEAMPLSKFILTFNNLFDVYNSSTTDSHPLRQPYTGK